MKSILLKALWNSRYDRERPPSVRPQKDEVREASSMGSAWNLQESMREDELHHAKFHNQQPRNTKEFRCRDSNPFMLNSTTSNLEIQKDSDTGTRTRVSCVKGKYANHLHHIGSDHSFHVLNKI